MKEQGMESVYAQDATTSDHTRQMKEQGIESVYAQDATTSNYTV